MNTPTSFVAGWALMGIAGAASWWLAATTEDPYTPDKKMEWEKKNPARMRGLKECQLEFEKNHKYRLIEEKQTRISLLQSAINNQDIQNTEGNTLTEKILNFERNVQNQALEQVKAYTAVDDSNDGDDEN